MRVSPSRRRFIQGNNQTRYMPDGVTIRCQAVSKGAMARMREERSNPNLTSDDVWPEGQCRRPAVPGKLLCGGRGGHGGGSRNTPMLDIVSLYPPELGEKLAQLMQNPDYLSRRNEMLTLVARNLVILERLKDSKFLGADAVGDLKAAIRQIERGEIVKGIEKANEILDGLTAEREAMDEWRTNAALLKDMSRTEVASIEKLSQIMTADQVAALAESYVDDTFSVIDELVDDTGLAGKIKGTLLSRIHQKLSMRQQSTQLVQGLVEGEVVADE